MKDKAIKIFRENGFLIFLFICVCIVAIMTISILNEDVDKDKGKDDLIILDNPVKRGIIQGARNSTLDLESGEIILDGDYRLVANDSVEETDENYDYVEEVFYEGQDEGTAEIEFIENYVEETRSRSNKMIWPVKGKIITDFTEDKLIYSETLGEWRGHSGIDIQGDAGSNVLAALDGRVSKVYEDSLWGKTIVLDHGEGLQTKYCNLGTLEMVREGIEIKQGDYIGTIGKSAPIESLMEAHLHFEVINKDKTVDPRSIMD